MPTLGPAGRLQAAREAAGYATSGQFSERHGIPWATYYQHEAGGRGIRPAVAKRYAALLGNCSAAWLLFGEGRSPFGRSEAVHAAFVPTRPMVSDWRGLS